MTDRRVSTTARVKVIEGGKGEVDDREHSETISNATAQPHLQA